MCVSSAKRVFLWCRWWRANLLFVFVCVFCLCLSLVCPLFYGCLFVHRHDRRTVDSFLVCLIVYCFLCLWLSLFRALFYDRLFVHLHHHSTFLGGLDQLYNMAFVFSLIWCLAHRFALPWALCPLRVSAGPSWFCRTVFNDDKVEKKDCLIWACADGSWFVKFPVVAFTQKMSPGGLGPLRQMGPNTLKNARLGPASLDVPRAFCACSPGQACWRQGFGSKIHKLVSKLH